MREIKFRAWDEDGHMFTPLSIVYKSDGSCDVYDQDQSFGTHGSAVTLMPYTGLKDKNGVEIYEGDIVSMYPGSQPFAIEMENTGCGCHNGYGYPLDSQEAQDSEVLGNIYENPGLVAS